MKKILETTASLCLLSMSILIVEVCKADATTSSDSTANAAVVLATAQASLQQAQLNNQKTEIENIQAALTAPDASKLKYSGTPATAGINATFYARLDELLENTTWGIDVTSCSNVILQKPVLQTTLMSYQATNAKLEGVWQSANAIGRPYRAALPPSDKMVPFIGAIGGVAAVDAVANLALNIVAAAKAQTALASNQLSKADSLVRAAVVQALLEEGKPVYDPDAYVPVLAQGAPACPTTLGELRKLDLTSKAVCAAEMIDLTQALLDTKAAEAAKAAKPDADKIKALANSSKALAQTNTDFQKLLTANADGVMPMTLALQGEHFNTVLQDKNACVLNVSVMTADADEVARDSTFSSYKLSIKTTTTVSWALSRPDGKIEKSGYKALTTPWELQAFDVERKNAAVRKPGPKAGG